MGVLDDAIRDHLDLKRRHGASEQELRRQEAEALGPARRDSDAPGDTGGESVGVQLEEPPRAGDASPDLFDQTADSAAFEREASTAEPAAGPDDQTEASDDLARAAGVAHAEEEEEEGSADEVPSAERLEGAEPSGAPEAAATEAEEPASETIISGTRETQAPSDETVVAADSPATPTAPTSSREPEVAPDAEGEAEPSPESIETDELLIEYDEELLTDEELLEEDEELLEEDEELVEEGAMDEGERGAPAADAGAAEQPEEGVSVVEGGLVEEELTREELAEEGLAGDDVLEETPDFLQEAPEDERLWFEQQPPRDFDLDR